MTIIDLESIVVLYLEKGIVFINNIIYGGVNMLEIPDSLERLFEKSPLLKTKIRGLPDLGASANCSSYSTEVKKIYDAFSIYGNELYQLNNDKIKGLQTRSLGGGSPMRAPIFPPCKERMLNVIEYDDMSEYPLAAGDEEARKEIVGYLEKEGFKSPTKLSEDNIIFTVSTTQAFNIIMNVIARPYDIVLMTGPNYGLFTFVPERSIGATVEILPLSEEDNWYVNPKKLSDRIDKLNNELENEYGSKLGYIPRVVAFLNENPHNPLGKVMNNNNKELLEQIGEVCLNKGVFVIDDIIYRDLTYDRNNLSLPMATNERYFDNTITMTGLSKSFGLAGLRTGMIVANEAIIRGVRNYIFQTMDSSPILQGKAMAGAFNASERRYQQYEDYFNPIIAEYKYRLELLKGMIEGLASIKDEEVRHQVENDIRKYADSDFNLEDLMSGIPDVHFVNGTIPESGFFALLDYTKLKGKGADGREIISETELLKYMYEQEKIKIILGQSISFPNEEQLIGRVTTALEREDIVDYIGAMNRCLRKLR